MTLAFMSDLDKTKLLVYPQTGSQFRGTFELDAAPFDWGKDYKRPNLPPEDVIVYEMGVRSFTADESSGVGPGKEGTYAGLIAKVLTVTWSGHTCLACLIARWRSLIIHASCTARLARGRASSWRAVRGLDVDL